MYRCAWKKENNGNRSRELLSAQRMCVPTDVFLPPLAYAFSLALCGRESEIRRHCLLPKYTFWLFHSVTSRAKVQVEVCPSGFPRCQCHSLPSCVSCLARWNVDAYPTIMGPERPEAFPTEEPMRETYD